MHMHCPIPKLPAGTPYNDRHNAALAMPAGNEAAIIAGCFCLARLASEHLRRFEVPIGEDYVLGDAWLTIASGILASLNGETGRLDCGVVDGWLRDTAAGVGFGPDDLAKLGGTL